MEGYIAGVLIIALVATVIVSIIWRKETDNMHMLDSGLKASELIKILEKKIEKHGDQYVFSGGTDYPECVEGIRVQEKGDGYISEGSFYI